ncbi:MAG: hypothetical protein JSR98_06565 [Proteobacteria bacterium]|nr:hypothetical protein [Pseudomonadota bacterium]
MVPVRASTLAAAVFLAFGLTGASQAAPPKPAVPTVSELVVIPEKVASELDVIAKAQCLPPKRDPSVPAARLVSTFPQQGATVRPGFVVVRLTFDRPMSCNGLLKPDVNFPDPCPGDRQEFRQSVDRLTFWTICLAKPGHRFGLWLNEPGPDDGSGLDAFASRTARFESLAGWPAQPYRLIFATSDGPLVDSIEDALAQDPETARRMKR